MLMVDYVQGSAALWLTGRSGRLSSEATLNPSTAGEQAMTLARSDASAAEEAGFIIDAASSWAGKLRVSRPGLAAFVLSLNCKAPRSCSPRSVTHCTF